MDNSTYLGLDLGTSGVKALLVDDAQRVIGSHTAALSVSRPAPGRSEQDPQDWWRATEESLAALAAAHPDAMARVAGIGLSGQMHGAVLLDSAGAVLRPAILWNDVRSSAECAELEAAEPSMRAVTGNIAFPGFTAPKLLWVRKHEPEVFARIAHVVLPKAWLRYVLTGALFEDMSDASGTLWLDVGRRDWSDAMLAATGLVRAQMPPLVEGTAPAGTLKPELAARFGMRGAPVLAGGAGDNAAGAVGLGAIEAGSAFISLGTSGVMFVTTDRFLPNPDEAVHAFCHTVPGTWHQMGVTLSAAASFAWWAGVTGMDEAALLAELPDVIERPSEATFLPYLAGERTPHNDGAVRGVFAGLTLETGRAAMTQAVLEGVAFSMRDCLDGLMRAGSAVAEADVIGGGSRSRVWIQMLASVLGLRLHRLAGGEQGAAFGAARLARLAVTGEAPAAVCLPPERVETFEPDSALAVAYRERMGLYRALYPAIVAASRMPG
jgi:xylulokinase